MRGGGAGRCMRVREWVSETWHEMHSSRITSRLAAPHEHITDSFMTQTNRYTADGERLEANIRYYYAQLVRDIDTRCQPRDPAFLCVQRVTNVSDRDQDNGQSASIHAASVVNSTFSVSSMIKSKEHRRQKINLGWLTRPLTNSPVHVMPDGISDDSISGFQFRFDIDSIFAKYRRYRFDIDIL